MPGCPDGGLGQQCGPERSPRRPLKPSREVARGTHAQTSGPQRAQGTAASPPPSRQHFHTRRRCARDPRPRCRQHVVPEQARKPAGSPRALVETTGGPSTDTVRSGVRRDPLQTLESRLEQDLGNPLYESRFTKRPSLTWRPILQTVRSSGRNFGPIFSLVRAAAAALRQQGQSRG